jgi:hypothetical protein
MPNQKISELTAIVTVDNSVDVLPIVDISANTTKKVTPNALKTALALDNVNNTSDANKPVSIAQQDALNAKVDENAPITAGTAPKITFDAKGLVTSGDSLDETDLPTGINANKIGTGAVSSTEFGYLDGVTSAIQTQIDGKQATLVSGTNIKTINGATVLGAGDLTITGNPPSGVSGAIQFTDGSAFASDAANLFWNNTTKRLGVGLNTPATTLDILPPVQTATATQFDCMRVGYSNSTIGITNGSALQVQVATTGSSRYSTTLRLSGNSDTSQAYLKGFASNNFGVMLNRTNSNLGLFSDNGIKLGDTTFAGTEGAASGMVHIKGSGSTSATTSLLVQNSAGTSALTITDDRNATFGSAVTTGGNIISGANVQAVSTGYFILQNRILISSPSVGILKLGNNNDNDFDRLQFGGTTSSFPAIKKASNNIQIKNADDTFGAGLSVGSALNASAILQADSTTKGFLPPRMSNSQRTSISSPAVGLMVYCTDAVEGLYVYKSTGWTLVI